MSFSPVFHVARALLLLTSLCALGTWVTWTQYPGRIGRMDYTWRREYVQEHEDRYKEAVGVIDSGDKKGGLRMLEELASDLEPIQKRDRLDKVKRNTLARLMTDHAGMGDMERSAEFADALLEFDDRDLGHAVIRALVLEHTPARESEAEEILVDLLRRVPKLHAASTAYSAYLLRHERPGEAVDVILSAVANGLSEIPLGGWTGYWDSGTGFMAAKRQVLLLEATRNPNEYWCSLKIPRNEPGLKRFRLDLPPSVTFRISTWRLGFVVAGELVEVINGLDRHEKIKQMREVDGALIVEGGRDAWISYLLPESLHAVKGVSVRFRATIDPVLPKAMRDLAQDEARSSAVREWFEARGRLADFERFLELARA